MGRRSLPLFAALFASAWLVARAAGRFDAVAVLAAGAMPLLASVAVGRRRGRRRTVLAVSLAGIALVAGTAFLCDPPLAVVLGGAAVLLLPVPVLYALTFPADGEGR